MIVKGYNVKGYKYTGVPSLATIGTLVYHYDYRFGLASQIYSSIERVNTLQDLGPNGLSVASSGQSSNITRPKVLTGGIGMNNISPNSIQLIGPPNPKLNVFHNGAPCFQMFVARLDNTTGTGAALFSTLLSGKAGSAFRLIPSSRTLNLIVFNNTGTNIRNYATANNSVPLGEFCLFAHLYYGAGTGSNNAKLWVKDVLTQATANPTHGTNDPTIYTTFSTIGNTEFIGKMTVGYDLSGKTPAQCDAFATLAFQTLKLDSEYSSLVTP